MVTSKACSYLKLNYDSNEVNEAIVAATLKIKLYISLTFLKQMDS